MLLISLPYELVIYIYIYLSQVLYSGVILFDSHSMLGSPNLTAARIGSRDLLAPLWSENKCFGTTEVSYHLYETCESSLLLEPASQKTSPKQNEVIARAIRDLQKYHKLTQPEINTVLVATWTNYQSAVRNVFERIRLMVLEVGSAYFFTLGEAGVSMPRLR